MGLPLSVIYVVVIVYVIIIIMLCRDRWCPCLLFIITIVIFNLLYRVSI